MTLAERCDHIMALIDEVLVASSAPSPQVDHHRLASTNGSEGSGQRAAGREDTATRCLARRRSVGR